MLTTVPGVLTMVPWKATPQQISVSKKKFFFSWLQSKFKISMSYMRPCLKTPQTQTTAKSMLWTKSWEWWPTPVIPAGGTLKQEDLKIETWAAQGNPPCARTHAHTHRKEGKSCIKNDKTKQDTHTHSRTYTQERRKQEASVRCRTGVNKWGGCI